MKAVHPQGIDVPTFAPARPSLDKRATARRPFVDILRGLLVAHMALDHASLFFNAGRAGEELASEPPPFSGDVLQFLTRFTGVPVAPAFFFLAGFMVALTGAARAERGMAHDAVTRRLIVRGLVLIAVDALVMGLPRALLGFYSFVVLSSIGAALIVLALVRHLPSRVLLPAALAVLALAPLIDASALPVALRAILFEPVRSGPIRSLYPIVPWCAIVVIGFVVGRDAVGRADPALRWAGLGGVCLLVFVAVRMANGYGNAYPFTSVTGLDFWFFAKYPPDLPFLAFSFAATFLGMAVLSRLTADGTPKVLEPFALFGRVAFFFYVVHFYVLGIAAGVVRAKFGLAETYAIWAALLIAMAWPCAWYAAKKRDRPNLVTRYF